jgi:hypothetical protein
MFDYDSEASEAQSIGDCNPSSVDLADYKLINVSMLNIATFNINSITCDSRLEQLSVLAHELNLSCLCLVESKLSDDIDPCVFKMDGYTAIHKHRNRHGGGVLVYIRQDIPFSRITPNESQGIEHISVDILVNKQVHNINVFYRPPNSDLFSQNLFLSDISTVLKGLRRHPCHKVIITGDMNFGSVYNYFGALRDKPLDNRAPEVFGNNGFQQLIDRPTRYQGLSVSLIDLIFVNSSEGVLLAGVLSPIADHCGTFISINSLVKRRPDKVITVRDYNKVDWPGLTKHLEQLPSQADCHNLTVNQHAAMLSESLIYALNTFVPTKLLTLRHTDAPWFRPDIKFLIKRKKRAFKSFRQAGDDLRLNISADPVIVARIQNRVFNMEAKYKKANKEWKCGSRRSKNQYFNSVKNILANPHISSKKKFSILTKLTKSGKDSCIPPLIEDDQVIHDPLAKANIFNNHFVAKSKLENCDENPPTTDHIDTATILNNVFTSTFEVGNLIKNMKESSYSPCGIPSKFLKETLKTVGQKLTKPICDLLNTIYTKGVYPDSWKVQHITPVFKQKGSNSEKKNYRPISILATLSKLCESIVHNRLIDHLTCNNIISKYQAAYLPGDSTAQQLLYMIHKIKGAWSMGKVAQACFLDVSSAFDAVWHNGLICKLESINVKGAALELLKSYLNERRATTVIEGVKSLELPLQAGVPQGSRLGPLLFILYINDIADGLECLPLIYADDTTLIAFGESTHDTTNMLNRDLDKISKWASKWKTKFNADKSTDMIFSKGLLNNSPPIFLDGTIIDRVSTHKHLGVILTSNLDWDSHLKKIIKNVNCKLSIIWKIKQLSRRTLDVMYKLHIRSTIDYCIQVFGPCLSNSQILMLDTLQYRAARIVTGALKCTSKVRLYKDLGWESTENRITLLSLCHLHKIILGMTRPLIKECLPDLKDFNKSRTSTFKRYQTRDKDFNNTFFPKMVEKWENLDKRIKNFKEITEFKINLKEQLKPTRIKHLSLGTKYGNKIHTQIRCGRSQLRQHLFEVGNIQSPRCLCHFPRETTEHYLLDCFLYSIERNELLSNLRGILEKDPSQYTRAEMLEILLYGEKYLEPEKYPANKIIQRYVHRYLISTKRLAYFRTI